MGIHHNYHVTKQAWKYPTTVKPSEIVFDGFSPNLNKGLHVGHLKNLCIAAAITNITNAKPVAMLGAANGVKQKEEEIKEFESVPEEAVVVLTKDSISFLVDDNGNLLRFS